MVVAPDVSTVADVIFVIEGTAISGAYLNDIKTNYIIPTLEYFNQGVLEEREYVYENTSAYYGIVVYHAADRLPSPSTDIYGPYSSPHKLLHVLDKIELIGGRGESHANVGEGLASALQCLDDLSQRRESGMAPQRHCILISNSPPYMIPVMENQNYAGNTAEQMAAILNEKGIHLSILSPRKIPAMFKLFEKSGGDLTASQTKNYAKDPRHLVLLKGFSLKERPVSPTGGAGPMSVAPLSSPLPSHGSPMAPGPPPQAAQPNQSNPPILPAVATGGGVVGPPPGAPGGGGRGFPPAYGVRPPANRWPMMPPQGPRYPGPGSALIEQLTRPPTAIPPQFNNAPGMNPAAGINQQPQQQPTPQQFNAQHQQSAAQQAQQLQQVQQQQRLQLMGAQGVMGQPQQPNVMPPNSQGMIGQPSNVTVVMPMVQNPQMTSNVMHQQQPNPGAGMPQQPNPQVQAPRPRHTIWQGIIEWIDKKATDPSKLQRQVPCQVSIASKDSEPELKADMWPSKLIMQLMPKQLIGSIGGTYLKNSKSVLFHPQPCEALDALTKVMTSGFAGCVHFSSSQTAQNDIKVLILLFTAEKKGYLGFIPNDQAAFVDRLRKVIQHSKTSHLNKQGVAQGQMGPGPQVSNQQPGMSGMLQNQIQQQQQPISGGMTSQGVGPGGGQMMAPMQPEQSQQQQPGSGQGGPYSAHLVDARQENLVKIKQLQETLEAAQQRELAYQTQLLHPSLSLNDQGAGGNRPYPSSFQVMNQIKMGQPQMQQEGVGLRPQQTPDQFKLEQEQKKQLRAQLQQMQQQAQQAQQQAQQQQQQVQQQQQQQVQQQQVQQQQQQVQQQQQQLRGLAPGAQAPGQQRMMRPPISNNPGLRHLLQQPQYRLNMQQQMPRPGMNNQPGQQGQNQPQFDDVSSYDFLN